MTTIIKTKQLALLTHCFIVAYADKVRYPKAPSVEAKYVAYETALSLMNINLDRAVRYAEMVAYGFLRENEVRDLMLKEFSDTETLKLWETKTKK